jgi:kynurenine formamidase
MDFAGLYKQLSNWGRWGDDDEIGTLNLVTADVVRRAVGCVRRGAVFPLGIPLSADGPQTGAIEGRVNPERSMIAVNAALTDDPDGVRTSDDVDTMGLQAATHWDSLAHVSYGGRLYNGFPASSVTDDGASRCGIDKIRSLVSRGVLLDVPRALGVTRLEPGHALTAEDLDAAEALAGTAVGSGDVVLIRTGQMQLLHEGRKWDYLYPSPGPSMMTVPWFHERDVAAVATDTLTFEVYPPEVEGLMLPVHLLHLVEMGMTQGQNFDLEALAADCAGDGVYECLLDATPQRFVGGLGSPVNPVAIK